MLVAAVVPVAPIASDDDEVEADRVDDDGECARVGCGVGCVPWYCCCDRLKSAENRPLPDPAESGDSALANKSSCVLDGLAARRSALRCKEYCWYGCCS